MPVEAPDTPEQRVVEAALPLSRGGYVTGWAALRLRGGAFFDGLARQVPVVVPLSTNPRPRCGVRWIRRAGDADAAIVGVPVATAGEALLDLAEDEVARGRAREAVVALDMAAAAGVGDAGDLLTCLRARRRVAHRCDIERVAQLAASSSLSPPESRLRLIWVLDTDLPTPVLNTWVCDTAGRPLAVPDLLEPESGLVVEYDGGVHAGLARRTRDAHKDDVYRELGLESIRVTALDMRRPAHVARRLTAAYARALGRPRERAWTVGEVLTGAHVRQDGRSA